jgi:hypothetical protein
LTVPPSVSRPKPRTLTWRHLYVWYVVAFALCVIGAVGHDYLFTPDVWKRWAELRARPTALGMSPMWSDIARAGVGFVLSMLGLQWLDVMSERHARTLNRLRFSRAEIVLISVAVTAALFFAFSVLPSSFFIECLQLVSTGAIKAAVPFTYGEIWRSYAAYAPYVLGLWLGMVFPIFFFFLRSIRDDVQLWSKLSADVERFDDRTDRDALDAVWLLWLERRDVLKVIATHYLPVLTFVGMLLLLEKLAFRVSSTTTGEVSGLAAMSLMLLPASVISLYVFTVRYAREYHRTERWLRDFKEHARGDPALTSAALEKINALEAHSSMGFFWVVLLSRGYVLGICFALVNFAFANSVPSIFQIAHAQPTATPASPVPPRRF